MCIRDSCYNNTLVDKQDIDFETQILPRLLDRKEFIKHIVISGGECTLYSELENTIDILNNNTYIWREILPEGYFEPLTNIGVDHPFLNDNHYIFTPTIFSVTPDLNDITTKNIFDELWYTKNGEITSIKPKNNLDDIGKPCL